MSQSHYHQTFKAEFFETDRTTDECRETIEHAVQHAFGLNLIEITRTGASDNGDLQNIWFQFDVNVNDIPEEERTPKGRLLEHLSGTDVRLHQLDKE